MTKLRGACLAVLVAVAMLAGIPVQAQQTQDQGKKGAPAPSLKPTKDYSKGLSHLPNIFNPYRSMKIEEPQLTNSPRVEQLTRDGKLMLSLQDAISLALENNLDISVQRYAPQIADTAVLRAKAGQGTAAFSFDPTLTSLFLLDRRSFPVNNPLLSGGFQSAITSSTTQTNFVYSQGFPTGTAYSITFNNTRSSSSSGANVLNPSVQSVMNFAFSQPLLDGLGYASNKRFLRLARNNKKIADLAFSDQVINTVSSVQNQYWDLVFGREDVKVKQRSVELAEKLYNDNKRQVEIGTLAPIEVVRAEAEVARTRQDLIVAQTFLLQQQTLLKSALTKNSMDPAVLNAEIVPTDAISKPGDLPVLPLPDAVREAWENRPDIRQAQIDLDNRHISVRSTRNSLLPSLTLNGQYGGTGLAGDGRILSAPVTVAGPQIVDATGTPVAGLFVPATQTTITGISKSGFTDAFGKLTDFGFPNYSVSLNRNIPIRNRAAQADSAQAILEERQSETRMRQLQNTIVVQVRNAQIALEQNRARVEAAQKSRELQERTLDAEQKKYQLGASTIFFVIQAQRDLAQAQSTEVSSLAALLKARVEFDRSLGRTLKSNNISLSDAKAGEVPREQLIPGTVAAAPVNGIGSQKY